MFVCAVQKISHVMMKWRRRASPVAQRPPSFATRQVYFVTRRSPKRLNDERFGRFSKHRSIVDPQQTLEICAFYEDSSNF